MIQMIFVNNSGDNRNISFYIRNAEIHKALYTCHSHTLNNHLRVNTHDYKMQREILTNFELEDGCVYCLGAVAFEGGDDGAEYLLTNSHLLRTVITGALHKKLISNYTARFFSNEQKHTTLIHCLAWFHFGDFVQ